MTTKDFESFIDWRINQFMERKKYVCKPKSFFGKVINRIKKILSGGEKYGNKV